MTDNSNNANYTTKILTYEQARLFTHQFDKCINTKRDINQDFESGLFNVVCYNLSAIDCKICEEIEDIITEYYF